MNKKTSQLQADNVVGGLAKRISWQSAFIQAMKMELRGYEGILGFVDDQRLTKEPLRIDCVVTKTKKNVQIKKNIAAIFREHNLIEYKSPGEYVSVADFYKVYAYACLYISIHNVPITSLTVSFVESRYPRKLLRHLQEVRGFAVAENIKGIYTIEGDIIPMQIIDTRRLSAEENLWLKSLSNDLDQGELARIGEEITRHEKSADIAAYLYAIAKANHKTLKEAIKMNDMQTIEKVFEDVGWTAKWEARGEAKGEARGTLEIARKMKNAGRPLSEITEFTGLPSETVEKL